MKYLKRYNELYDSDELKASNEIEGMSGGFVDKVESIGTLGNNKLLLYNKIIRHTPQLAICLEKSNSYYYMRDDEENDMIYFCFDGELCVFEIGFRKDGELYTINRIYSDYVDSENSYEDTETDLTWKEVENSLGNDLLDTLESIGFTEVSTHITNATNAINLSLN